MKATSIILSVLSGLCLMTACGRQEPERIEISRESLMNKIKGAWAGQTIGCTYGGPTEFRYSGTMINDNIPIEWPDGYIKWYFDNVPGLYDDVYMDLTFVEVFEKEGLDAPVSSFEQAFSSAGYKLWHANQQARYNIRQGMSGKEVGYWENNPHADDIDFQIEADYAGIMAPGMPNAAAHYCDDIGHMMNYGDGWYGGVYVAAMYALAFVSDDIDYIVREALKCIPEQSKYYKCMSDVIRWHEEYPDNWELCWALCQKNHSFDIGCPDGVWQHFNIDATINSAYILVGLLYGEGDFTKTMDISTRCGYDSDCNPASAAGILGTIIGYDAIPEKYLKSLKEVEDIDFDWTDICLNEVYGMSFNQALKVIAENGGEVNEGSISIRRQTPQAVRFEESFAGHWPEKPVDIWKSISEVGEISFDGKGIVVRYSFGNRQKAKADDYAASVDVYLDGRLSETVSLPLDNNSRKQELYYKYNLSDGPHTLSFKWTNPESGRDINISSYIIYRAK